MSRYGKYFLQNLLCLEDALCHYYVQDDSWGRQEILDVEYIIFDWDDDAETWLIQCAEHDPYTTMSRLRSLLAEDCLTQYQVYRMNDQQVVRTAARELSNNAYRMVIEPKIGWAVRVDPVTGEPVQPIAVEAAPDIDDMLDELRVELDGLVDDQKNNYRKWEAKLADMSDAEKAALYGKKAGGGLYNATIGSLVDLVKAAPGLAKKAASAWWKFKTYPLRLAQITAQAIKTGSMDPLQKEIKAKLGPVVRGAKQLQHFTSMTMVLLGEETTRDMLLDFVDRYWHNTHPLEKTELGTEAASEVVINILLAIFTAGAGVAANVAAKSGRLIKVAKMLERVAGFLKRMKSLGRLPKKRAGLGKGEPKANAKAGALGKGPEQPKTPEKKPSVDDDKKKDYSGKSEKGDLKQEDKKLKIPIYKDTKPMKSDYIGEETGSVWGTKVKYLTDAERAKYKVTIKDGRLYDSTGKLFDTKSASSVFPDGGGKAIFVMDEYGDVFVSKTQAVGKFHHSSFLAGKPVAAAGEISVKNGVVKEITRRSGHYMPEEKHLNQFVHRLESSGVETGGVKISSGF